MGCSSERPKRDSSTARADAFTPQDRRGERGRKNRPTSLGMTVGRVDGGRAIALAPAAADGLQLRSFASLRMTVCLVWGLFSMGYLPSKAPATVGGRYSFAASSVPGLTPGGASPSPTSSRHSQNLFVAQPEPLRGTARTSS